MTHDALDRGMFWAGLLMALAPIVFGGILLALWWWRRRKSGGAEGTGS
ncbi:MAG: hypothetical protein M3373_12260 [Gemmatimonadota bacterium]|nr:hypothetical protein [Gemmatimonadota bacterium]